MQTKALISALLVATLGLLQGSAFAAPGHDNRDGCRPGDRGCQRYYQQRGHDDHDDDRGAGPDQRFHRGDRLPPDYRGRQYVVNDWHGHGLRQPPRGYQWVQNGGDYVLVAITTGVILDLLLSH